MNLHNCFNAQGNFIPKLFYVETYKTFPNCFQLTFTESDYIDVSKIDDKLIERIFGFDVETIKNTYINETTTSSVKNDEDDGLYWMNGEYVQTIIRIHDKANKRFYDITKSSIEIFHKEGETVIKDWIVTLKKFLPKLNTKPKSSEIGLIAYDNGYYTVKSKVNKMEIDIDENYNDDFLPVHKDIINFIDQQGSGLIILNGVKGSGKTSYIKYLTSQYPKKYRIVTNAIAQRLAEPDFISFLLEEKDSIFILEDCEQILMDRSENTFGGAISNILNMSDGLMSDIFNIKFICTFNADINKIDSALLRKGRCFANYEFKELSADKVKHLSEKHNLGINVMKPMTLAEIYNYESTDYDSSNKPKKKIGF